MLPEELKELKIQAKYVVELAPGLKTLTEKLIEKYYKLEMSL